MLPVACGNMLQGALLHISRTLVSTLIFDLNERRPYLLRSRYGLMIFSRLLIGQTVYDPTEHPPKDYSLSANAPITLK